ncbi:hypothetical protein ACHAP6_006554 [Verticillium nonalfalfae]
MFSSITQAPMLALGTALSVLLVPAMALDLALCYDRDYRGGCANKWPMPVNSCFSNRGGSNWSGFTNDAVTSFRISGGCCRFYKDADCQGGPMFTECNIDVPSIHDRYGQFNDQLSSVFCY